MTLVFLDSNIYLDSYRHGARKYLELLPYIATLHPDLFVTAAIVREVERNRVQTYLSHQKTLPSLKLNLPSIFPYFLTTSIDINKFYKDLKSIIDITKQQYNAYSKIFNETNPRNVDAIAQGTDFVSSTLAGIFTHRIFETDGDIARARRRKELGQPPGKRGDALGDQISWEQLLKAAAGQSDIWIVTRDGDFCFKEPDGVIRLHPPLDRELRSIKGVMEVKCFDQLGDFFDSARASGVFEKKALPSQEETRAANQEIAVATADLGFISPHWYAFEPDHPCSVSPNGKHIVPGAALYPSKHLGARTYQGPCMLCGSWVDTLELVD